MIILKNIKEYKIKIIIIFLFLGLSFLYIKISINADISLISRTRGKILLQVEKNGEAWYVDPHTDSRLFLGKPDNALELMKNFSLGISNEDISKIPLSLNYLSGIDSDGDELPDSFEDAIGTNKNLKDSDNDGYNDKEELINNYNPNDSNILSYDIEFAKQHSGELLIQTAQNGEVWYVETKNNKRYFLGRPRDAFNVMLNLGLGISNEDISKIPEYYIDETLNNDYIVKNSTKTILENPNIREYMDNNYKFQYPINWKIKKSSEKNNILFLGDYDKNLFSEKKGFLTLSYIEKNEILELDNFKIESKEKAEKYLNEIKNINNYKVLLQGFKYAHMNSFEITATVKKNQNEFLQILLVSSGDEEKYTDILNRLIESIEFVESSCQSCQ